jgi:hypothetical protein
MLHPFSGTFTQLLTDEYSKVLLRDLVLIVYYLKQKHNSFGQNYFGEQSIWQRQPKPRPTKHI